MYSHAQSHQNGEGWELTEWSCEAGILVICLGDLQDWKRVSRNNTGEWVRTSQKDDVWGNNKNNNNNNDKELLINKLIQQLQQQKEPKQARELSQFQSISDFYNQFSFNKMYFWSKRNQDSQSRYCMKWHFPHKMAQVATPWNRIAVLK